MSNEVPVVLRLKVESIEAKAIRTAQAAKLLGLSRSAFYLQLKNPKFPQGCKLGRARVWLPTDLLNWVQQNTRSGCALGSAAADDRGVLSTHSIPNVDRMLSELQEAQTELDRMRDLLRWRDSMGEPPANSGRYLVTHGCADSEFDFEFALYDATRRRWSNGDARYWRPIGPLPGKGDE